MKAWVSLAQPPNTYNFPSCCAVYLRSCQLLVLLQYWQLPVSIHAGGFEWYMCIPIYIKTAWLTLTYLACHKDTVPGQA